MTNLKEKVIIDAKTCPPLKLWGEDDWELMAERYGYVRYDDLKDLIIDLRYLFKLLETGSLCLNKDVEYYNKKYNIEYSDNEEEIFDKILGDIK